MEKRQQSNQGLVWQPPLNQEEEGQVTRYNFTTVGVSVLTCFDSSKAECVCCPVRAAAEAARLWLLLPWMERPGSGAPSAPGPTDTFNWHEKKMLSTRLVFKISAGFESRSYKDQLSASNRFGKHNCTKKEKKIFAVSLFLYNGISKS